MLTGDLGDCPYPFDVYLKELTTNIVGVFDGDHRLAKCNQRLLHLCQLEKGQIKGKKIDELFIAESTDFPKLPLKNRYREFNLQLSDHFFQGADYLFKSYIFNADDCYYLIGEERRGGDEEILQKISLLNNALSNKTRKLTKKNKELEKANKRIEQLAKTDVLTGLANRRHFMDYFEKVFSQARRHSQCLSLLTLDLDKFKSINDTFGHDKGDDVLAALGDLLSEETREEDLPARIGGEEFAVLLTQAGDQDTFRYAERIREKISEMDVKGVRREITASLGISTLQSGDSPESMMKRADSALYEAKDNGRNRVCGP